MDEMVESFTLGFMISSVSELVQRTSGDHQRWRCSVPALASKTGRPWKYADVLVERVLLGSGVAMNRDDARATITAKTLVVRNHYTGAEEIVSHHMHKLDPRCEQLLNRHDQSPILMPNKPTYFLMNKPTNTITSCGKDTHQTKHRQTVMDLFTQSMHSELGTPLLARTYPVGRLDADTQGLILITNDGFLCRAMIHPEYGTRKDYIAFVCGTRAPQYMDRFTPEACKILCDGVTLGCGNRALAAQVSVIPEHQARTMIGEASWGHFVKQAEFKYGSLNGGWLGDYGDFVLLTMQEGKYREVRRMVKKAGPFFVRHLARVCVEGISDPFLGPGEMRPLTQEEIDTLYVHALQAAQPRDVVYDYETKTWFSFTT